MRKLLSLLNFIFLLLAASFSKAEEKILNNFQIRPGADLTLVNLSKAKFSKH